MTSGGAFRERLLDCGHGVADVAAQLMQTLFERIQAFSRRSTDVVSHTVFHYVPSISPAHHR